MGDRLLNTKIKITLVGSLLQRMVNIVPHHPPNTVQFKFYCESNHQVKIPLPPGKILLDNANTVSVYFAWESPVKQDERPRVAGVKRKWNEV